MASIDLESASLRPVSLIARERTGKRPSPATVWRWCKKGIRGGVKLEAVNIFGSWHTTSEAFAEFLRAQTAVAMAEPSGCTDDELRSVGLLPASID